MLKEIICAVGQFTRYFFLRLIGKKKHLSSLESRDDYKDWWTSPPQDFLNGLIGLIVCIMIVLIIAVIVT